MLEDVIVMFSDLYSNEDEWSITRTGAIQCSKQGIIFVAVMVLYLIIHELLIAHEMLKVCIFYIWVNGMSSYGYVCHIACTCL